ncbi:hypothetical protein F5Y06DRAFT_190244 [Hypoxylon sp. FL0890]|nr:hypothetical protein F5Y06DRAFT_190244 [Hypoxylon sp. FL0890]
MQRIIDAWNRNAYLQTYWDPRTGRQPHWIRLGSIPNDEGVYMSYLKPESDECSLKPQKEDSITGPGSAPSPKDDDSTNHDEIAASDLSWEDDGYVNIPDDPNSEPGLVHSGQSDSSRDSDSLAGVPLLTIHEESPESRQVGVNPSADKIPQLPPQSAFSISDTDDDKGSYIMKCFRGLISKFARRK